ncbi:MAG: glycosyltransferase family 2 protein [Candidatus Sumerlaeia bacterium]
MISRNEVQLSRSGSKTFHPFEGAHEPWQPWQRGVFIGITLGLVLQALVNPLTFFWTWCVISICLFGPIVFFKTLAVFIGQFHLFTMRPQPHEIAELNDSELPLYTLLFPVYKEAAILPQLLESIEHLDYPADKLDVKILLEQDDLETRKAIGALKLPAHVEAVVVPEGEPRTKPRACNYGLEKARGEFLVVYDAEDRPDGDQLKKAVAAFRKLDRKRQGEKIVCLQAHLDYYNMDENLLTKWFTLEYAAWFGLYLPGLYGLGSPIPLGGTSNHFRVKALREAGGWDAWNVTEDCDLGVRLARMHKHTRILDSTTWEEAASHILPWLRQRSRWTKGYWQTFLVHTRQPLHAALQMGPWRYLMTLLTVGGNILMMLVLPLCWIALFVWIAMGLPLFDPYRPWTRFFVLLTAVLILFNLYFVLVNVITALRRRSHHLLIPALLSPVYWLLLSLGAWFGFLQFFWSPFAWLKTPHGISRKSASREEIEARQKPMLGPVWTAIPFAFGLILLILVALSVPRMLHMDRSIRIASVDMEGASINEEKPLDVSWFGQQELIVKARLDAPKSLLRAMSTDIALSEAREMQGHSSNPAVRPMVYLKVMDGEWYQTMADDYKLESGILSMRLPLDRNWESNLTGAEWGPWCLRRIRSAGVRLFGAVSNIRSMDIIEIKATGSQTLQPFVPEITHAPESAAQYQLYETRFHIKRRFENPFDTDQVLIDAIFEAPSGKQWKIPAFYSQDYIRHASSGDEKLELTGEPYWAVRFMPHESGEYRWYLKGRDHTGATFESMPRTFTAQAAPGRGYLKSTGKYFTFENGDYYYPIAINICWPYDERALDIPGYEYKHDPDKLNNTIMYGDFFERMKSSGIDMGRVWMSTWWLGLEWRDDVPGYHGIGKYNLQNAWRLDYLFEQAQRYDLMLEVALNHHGPWTTKWNVQWHRNPYNKANGGFLSHHGEAMTDPRVIKLFKDRHRYCAARYGAYPNLFAWILWIEADTVHTSARVRREWHRIMGEHLTLVDQDRHLVSAEYSGAMWRMEWCDLDVIDYIQGPVYTRDKFVDRFEFMTDYYSSFGKPNLIEEYGGTSLGTSYSHLQLQTHNAPWLGWVIDTSGMPMTWWWNFTFDFELEKHWAIFVDFIRGENLMQRSWRFRDIPVQKGGPLSAKSRIAQDRAYVWVFHYQRTNGVHEPTHMFKDDPDAELFKPIKGAEITVPGLKDGRYLIEFWDTWVPGRVRRQEVISENGKCRIPLPTLTRDLAIKIYQPE